VNKKPSVRNVGTVCVGTVLLGLGCTQRDQDQQSSGESFDEPPAPQPRTHRRGTELPRPQFGPLGRKAAEEQRKKDEAENTIRLTIPVAPAKAEAPPRQELLNTASDTALAALEAPAAIPNRASPAAIIVANDRTPIALPVNPASKSEQAGQRQSAADPSKLPPENGQTSHITAPNTGPNTRPNIGPNTGPNTGPPPNTATAKASDGFIVGSNPSPEPVAIIEGGEEPQIALGLADDTDDMALQPDNTEIRPQSQPPVIIGPEHSFERAFNIEPAPQIPIPGAQALVEPPFDKLELADASPTPAVPDDVPAQEMQSSLLAASAPAPIPPDLPEQRAPERTPEPPLDSSFQPEAELVNPGLADAVGPSDPESANSENTDTVGSHTAEPDVTARRSVPARRLPAEDAASTETKLPSLQSMIPPQRGAFAVSSITLDQPTTTTPQPANDIAAEPPVATAAATAPVTSLIPPNRTQTMLGLDQADGQASAPAQLSDDNNSVFTASAQPPVLSYQDELILEIRIRGVEATDTVLAYGTRRGVYLPLGALARILDVAIIVSDDGHYANGWVLDEGRTVTINLREGTLEKAGETIDLAADTAVAFDGDLFFRADRLGAIMPLSAEVSLRSQAVTLETLEPFPFEERMRREAQRRRLAARGVRPNQQKFPREETPYRAASIPLADVEIRAISDSGGGTRVESDILLAGDLGFLTAEAFLGGDSFNGLTTSLVEVGRMDPDAELLGPLQATSFAVGDVSTVSMPIGLRGVAGRGFFATNTPAETVSVFEKIDLRGILPNGYEVELYRNDILVASTREEINGQYEFLQVPVDFGLNIFRLVFFGPQGQRSEEVRKITVGDGRLKPGKLVYRIGAVQKDQNLLGVRAPRFIAPGDFGTWRASAEVAYGLSSDITSVVSGAFFETETDNHWVASAGIRTGIGGFAVKGDVAASKGSAFAASLGLGGKIGSSAFTISHVEYSGDFIDETRSLAGDFLRRSTELDFNSTINLGNPVTGLIVPLTARARHLETASGRKQTNVALRASARIANILASNTIEYTQTSIPLVENFSRLFGNFDLATVGRNKTRGRISIGYQVLPDPEILTAAVEIDHAIDQDTAIRGSAGYAFQSKSTQFGLSAVRDFDRFTLALDGSYALDTKSYSVGLRLGFSFGRDPLRGNFFMARQGLAGSGGASVRAFRDMDGDGRFGPSDSVLPEVNVVAFNQSVPTGEDGIARLSGLGRGRGVAIQVDSNSLPDIDLAPAKDGIEIVPRAGRIHATEFPIIALSEVEGNVSFVQNGGNKGVSGVRLLLRNAKGEDASFSKTEIDGYYFFERVKPGTYSIALDPGQSERLNLCMNGEQKISIGFEPDIVKQDIEIGMCENVAADAR